MSNLNKCKMADRSYCRKSSFGYCAANDIELEKCPYLKAIGEIARLVAEQVLNENDGK